MHTSVDSEDIYYKNECINVEMWVYWNKVIVIMMTENIGEIVYEENLGLRSGRAYI